MNNPATDKILSLVTDLFLPFQQIRRQHRLPIGSRRLENDAEHSWTVSVLACALAPQIDSGLDVGKIAQFALVHDLVEVFAGDTKHFKASDSSRASKQGREHAALQRIQTEFSAFPWLGETIEEYEASESNEAAFVYAVDKYIAVVYDLLDRGLYLQQVGIDKARYDELMEAHRVKAHRHPQVGKYYDEVRDLIDLQPEFLNKR